MSKPPISDPSSNYLLSRKDVEKQYGIGARWLELAAWSGSGPPMVKISRRCVRYRRGELEAWLSARTVSNDGLQRS